MSVITKTLKHGATVQLSALLLTPWFRHRPDRTYRRARIIRNLLGQRALYAVSAQLALTGMCGRAPERGAIVIVNAEDNTVIEVDTDKAPPMVRAMLRFTMAVGNRDGNQAWAVWLSIPKHQRVGMTMALVAVAADHLKSHMDGGDDSADHRDNQGFLEGLPELRDRVPDDARDLTEGTS